MEYIPRPDKDRQKSLDALLFGAKLGCAASDLVSHKLFQRIRYHLIVLLFLSRKQISLLLLV